MMRTITAVLALALTSGVTLAQGAPPAARQDVPVTTVALFSSGVGYFEHGGIVRGNGTTELRFRTSQMNDVLKSLVLQDEGGGRVTTITYPSHDPLSKTLRSFQVDITANPTVAQLLNQLRGAHVSIQSQAEHLSGTILGVETRHRQANDKDAVIDIPVLDLLAETMIRSVDLQSLTSLTFDDPQLQDELTKALAALGQARDQDRKPVIINFTGANAKAIDAAQSVRSIASTAQLGELFEYTVGNVTLPRQKSAMIPIVTDNVDVERVSIYNAAVLASNPLYGVCLKNTTGKSLLQGPLTVLERGGYADDAQIDNLPAGQERLIGYGVDAGGFAQAVREHRIDVSIQAPRARRERGVVGRERAVRPKRRRMMLLGTDITQLLLYSKSGEIPADVRAAVAKAAQLAGVVSDNERDDLLIKRDAARKELENYLRDLTIRITARAGPGPDRRDDPIRSAASGACGLFDFAQQLTRFSADLVHRSLVLEVGIAGDSPGLFLEFPLELLNFALGPIFCARLHLTRLSS